MKQDSSQIGNKREGGAPEAQLSAVGDNQRLPPVDVAPVAVNISVRPQALVGVRIPSRNQHTRDLVERLYGENLHLQRADLLAVTRYAELCWKSRRLGFRLPASGRYQEFESPLPGDLAEVLGALGGTAAG